VQPEASLIFFEGDHIYFTRSIDAHGKDSLTRQLPCVHEGPPVRRSFRASKERATALRYRVDTQCTSKLPSNAPTVVGRRQIHRMK